MRLNAAVAENVDHFAAARLDEIRDEAAMALLPCCSAHMTAVRFDLCALDELRNREVKRFVSM